MSQNRRSTGKIEVTVITEVQDGVRCRSSMIIDNQCVVFCPGVFDADSTIAGIAVLQVLCGGRKTEAVFTALPVFSQAERKSLGSSMQVIRSVVDNQLIGLPVQGKFSLGYASCKPPQGFTQIGPVQDMIG